VGKEVLKRNPLFTAWPDFSVSEKQLSSIIVTVLCDQQQTVRDGH
jgi:hypothetical protein